MYLFLDMVLMDIICICLNSQNNANVAPAKPTPLPREPYDPSATVDIPLGSASSEVSIMSRDLDF